MIKVCMVVHQYYHRDGRVRRYADGLAAAGVQVDVLCPRDPQRPPMEQSDNIRVFTIPLGRGYKQRSSYLMEYGLAVLLFALRLSILHLKNRYHVIHVHNMPDFLILAALLPKMMGAKLILDIHDPMPEFYMSKYSVPANSLAVRLMRLQEKLSAWLANAVVTANPNFKTNLVKRGISANKVTVVNNVADTNLFDRSRYEQKHREKKQNFTLLYPGTIAPRYGLDVAIRSLPLLIEKIPNVRLLIIGAQVEYVQELTDLAKQLKVNSFVHFCPSIPVDQVPGQMVQADIGIYPALPDPHMDIATPSKVLEYAMMGLPIVASRLKILEDLFVDSALMFFEPGNVVQFANCVLELCEHPAQAEELIRQMDRIFVDVHSWQREQNRYFMVLNSLLSIGERGGVLSERDESSIEKIA